MTPFLLMLVTALPAAGDKSPPKANTLTPKEAADGWILLFDGEATFGWNGPLLATNPNRYGPLSGGAKVEAGVLHLGGEKEVSVWSSAAFGDFRLEFEYR